METFELEYVHQTHDGLLVYDDSQQEEVWLPKSEIEYDSDELDVATPGDIIELNIPEWLAKKEGLI